jgi:hypothetical protein
MDEHYVSWNPLGKTQAKIVLERRDDFLGRGLLECCMAMHSKMPPTATLPRAALLNRAESSSAP